MEGLVSVSVSSVKSIICPGSKIKIVLNYSFFAWPFTSSSKCVCVHVDK